MVHESNLLGDARFILHHAREISKTLDDLCQHQVPLNIVYDNAQAPYPTTIIAVDEKNKAVYLDISLDVELNASLLASKHLLLTKEDGLQVKWQCNKAVAANFKGSPAIKLELPTALLRLQRRDYFRLQTPVLSPVYCQLPLTDAHALGTKLDQFEDGMLELSLTDIGLGGVGAIVQGGAELALTRGSSFERCKISFPDVGVISVTLTLCYEVAVQLPDGSIAQRVGLQYMDMSRDDQDLIQRYMRGIERAKAQ